MVQQLTMAGVDVNMIVMLLAGFAAICMLFIIMLGLKLTKMPVGYGGIVFTMIILFLIAFTCIAAIYKVLTG